MGTTHLGMLGPPDAPWWVVLPSELPSDTSLAHQVSCGPEKISKKFRCIWTPSDIDYMRSKKMQNTATGTWHYVNRLVPKNDIK